jgi:hypothetical protein
MVVAGRMPGESQWNLYLFTAGHAPMKSQRCRRTRKVRSHHGPFGLNNVPAVVLYR